MSAAPGSVRLFSITRAFTSASEDPDFEGATRKSREHRESPRRVPACDVEPDPSRRPNTARLLPSCVFGPASSALPVLLRRTRSLPQLWLGLTRAPDPASRAGPSALCGAFEGPVCVTGSCAPAPAGPSGPGSRRGLTRRWRVVRDEYLVPTRRVRGPLQGMQPCRNPRRFVARGGPEDARGTWGGGRRRTLSDLEGHVLRRPPPPARILRRPA